MTNTMMVVHFRSFFLVPKLLEPNWQKKLLLFRSNQYYFLLS